MNNTQEDLLYDVEALATGMVALCDALSADEAPETLVTTAYSLERAIKRLAAALRKEGDK